MSRARDDRRRNMRAEFVQTIRNEAGQFWIGFADSCEVGYRRDGEPFYIDHSGETHDPAEHSFGDFKHAFQPVT